MELEKKIRPDLDQMLTLKDQLAAKLRGWANGGIKGQKYAGSKKTPGKIREICPPVVAVLSLQSAGLDSVVLGSAAQPLWGIWVR